MYGERVLPEIDASLCNGCGTCVEACPEDALAIVDGVAALVEGIEDCSYCGACEAACPIGAIGCPYEIVLEEQANQEGRRRGAH